MQSVMAYAVMGTHDINPSTISIDPSAVFVRPLLNILCVRVVSLALVIFFSSLIGVDMAHWDLLYGTLGLVCVHVMLVDFLLHTLRCVAFRFVPGLVSPVTQSVVNTLKRALLIWLSVLIFHNKVAPLSAVGTAICVMGVLAYNFAIRRYPAGGRPR